MNLFYDQAEQPRKRRLHFHAFMAEVHTSMQASQTALEHAAVAPESIAAVADVLAPDANLLCLDELEVTDIADAMILGRLFDSLFDRGVVLVATSNEPTDGLYRNGPNRELFAPFVERLKEHVSVVEIGGEYDCRSDGQEEVSTYLCPLNPENSKRFDRLWQAQLANGTEVQATLDVHGRKLELRRTLGRRLRATFAELCKHALNADDHLA
ncbi:MAG: cell division protein ZapE, partial [Terriglobales bacterium]